MKTAILSTGSELMNGTVLDTNFSWMAEQLCAMGIVPHKSICIGDSETDLTQTLNTLFCEYDIIICTGGLGPTTDDITAQAVAESLNVRLRRNATAEKQVKERFAARNYPMANINLKQADLPEGATVQENPIGTAPGFLVKKEHCQGIFLPGVPSEMKAMFSQHVTPLYGDQFKPLSSRECHTFGIGESTLQERLLPLEAQFETVTFAYRAAFPTLKTTVYGVDESSVIAAHQAIQQKLSGFVFATENKSLAQAVGEQLIAAHKTISTAESCTGGFISHELTQVAGCSAYVKGAIVAYENPVKVGLLGVNQQDIETFGAVSETVVTQMALGAQKQLQTDISIATSGIAGPTGGTAEKPVGTVHIAVASGDRIFHKKCLFKGYSRTKVKTASTWTALKMVLDYLLEKK